MGPVAAERIGGKVAVTQPAVEMADTALVAADRKIGAGVIARTIGTFQAQEIHAGLQPEEAVVETRAAGRRAEHSERVAVMGAVHSDHAAPANILRGRPE